MTEPTQDMTKPVVEMLEQGLTIMRAENDTQQAMAVQKPRNIKELTDRSMAELRAFPQFAKKAYYSIPYKDRSGEDGEKTVLVEGPSIKAANALARNWGNNASGFRVTGADDERILIQGVFLDYETNVRKTAEISVARKAWSKKFNKVIPLREDRLNMAIQAGGSKAVRNAILNGLPVGLVDGYFAEAKRIAASGGKAPETGPVNTEDIRAEMAQVTKAFENIGITADVLNSYVSARPELSDEEAVTAHLIGLLTAIQDGQVNAEEVFAVPAEDIREPQPAPAPQATAPKASPGAQKPPQDRAKPPIPPEGRPMKSKVEGGTCDICKMKVPLGTDIVFNTKTRRAAHRDHFA